MHHQCNWKRTDTTLIFPLVWNSLVIYFHVVKLTYLVKSYLAADIKLEDTKEIMASNTAVASACKITYLQSEKKVVLLLLFLQTHNQTSLFFGFFKATQLSLA